MTGRIAIQHSPANQRASLLEEVIRRCAPAAEKLGMDIEIILETDAYRFYLFERGLWTENNINFERSYATIVLSSKINEFSDLAYKGAVYHSIGKVFGHKRIADGDHFLYFGVKERAKEPVQEAVFDYAMLFEGGEVPALVAWKLESSKMSADEGAFNAESFRLYCETLQRRNPDLANVIRERVTRYLRRATPFDLKQYEN